jgi:hypothetical protein
VDVLEPQDARSMLLITSRLTISHRFLDFIFFLQRMKKDRMGNSISKKAVGHLLS